MRLGVGDCDWPVWAHRWKIPGGVVEWLMALVLKTSEVKASVGSNPTPSASQRSPPEAETAPELAD